jgi:hypothetical protein
LAVDVSAMTIYWEATAAARAGLTDDDMLRLSAASEQRQSAHVPAADVGRRTTEIVHTRLLIQQIVQRYPALFGLQQEG